MSFIYRFIPEVLYEGSSKFNQDIKVIRIGNTYKLIVNELVQSMSKNSKFAKKRVWGKVAKAVRFHKPKAKRILLLGMGAGTMVHLLNKEFKDNRVDITSIEIDKTIVNLGKKYFDLNTLNNNKIIVEDAFKICNNPKKYGINSKFDVAIIDTYLGDVYPKNISKNLFIENLLKMLNEDSFVIFNHVILRSEKKRIESIKNNLSLYLEDLKTTKINCHGISDNFLFHGATKRNFKI